MLGVFYLNEFDHFIKEKLNCKYYIRYIDDGIILMRDKKKLKAVYKVLVEEIKKYKLELCAQIMVNNLVGGSPT